MRDAIGPLDDKGIKGLLKKDSGDGRETDQLQSFLNIVCIFKRAELYI